MSSALATIFIVFVVIFPFLGMSALSTNYNRLKETEFSAKYGSLMEGIDCPHPEFEAYKAHYYPVFLMQRFIFAGTLLFLFPWPLAQVIIIGLSNILVLLSHY